MLRILNQGGDLMILPSSVDVQDATGSPIEKQLNTQALALLRQGGYILRRPNEVIEFLSRHSSLVEILEEAPRQIHRHFGDGTSSLILEVIQDPDAEGDEELILFIQTKLPVDQALQRLDRLDDMWWLDTGSRTQGNLGINLELL
jgi:hypothetical protein